MLRKVGFSDQVFPRQVADARASSPAELDLHGTWVERAPISFPAAGAASAERGVRGGEGLPGNIQPRGWVFLRGPRACCPARGRAWQAPGLLAGVMGKPIRDGCAGCSQFLRNFLVAFVAFPMVADRTGETYGKYQACEDPQHLPFFQKKT